MRLLIENQDYFLLSSDIATADSESVEELAEEGNAVEAEVVYGVENTKDPSVSEVKTRQRSGRSDVSERLGCHSGA